MCEAFCNGQCGCDAQFVCGLKTVPAPSPQTAAADVVVPAADVVVPTSATPAPGVLPQCFSFVSKNNLATSVSSQLTCDIACSRDLGVNCQDRGGCFYDCRCLPKERFSCSCPRHRNTLSVSAGGGYRHSKCSCITPNGAKKDLCQDANYAAG